MVDNFKQISEYISSVVTEDCKESFFNIAIIQRHKDGHKSGNSKNRTLKQYFVSNVHQLKKFEDEIKTLCEVFSSRAYVDVQKRSYIDYSRELNKELAERLYNNDMNKLYRITYSAATKCKREKSWILDVDDPIELKPVTEWLSERDIKPMITVKTKNGYHLIVKPFDLRVFSEQFKDVEVKKNNMTLLYYPKSLAEE